MSTWKLRCMGVAGVAGFAATACTNQVLSDDVPEEETEVATDAFSRRPSRDLEPGTRLYSRPPNAGAVDQVRDLLRARKLADAARIAALVTTPQAVWFVGGTPAEVKTRAKQTMAAAEATRSVPVLAVYNLPYRDCAQYSAGGAVDRAAYEDWIDGFAAGIGKGKAIVILEPDSLGIIPYNTDIYGTEEWCKPTVTDEAGNAVPAPGASPEERYAALRYAVDRILEKAPAASIYLDGSHSAWMGVGETAHRLYKAGFRDGVQRVQGFFLNVSNYRATEELTQYGTWVSMCLAAGTPGVGPEWMQNPETGMPHFDWCPSQYDSETGPQVNYTPEFAARVTAGLEGLMAGASARVRFVIDTGRNGQGPWVPPAGVYPDPQDWCNAPGRGAGARPRILPSSRLAAALLWVKSPGESDGSCNRGIAGSTTDPEWGGIVDPIASGWFRAQALELARLATPRLL